MNLAHALDHHFPLAKTPSTRHMVRLGRSVWFAITRPKTSRISYSGNLANQAVALPGCLATSYLGATSDLNAPILPIRRRSRLLTK